MPKLNRSAPGFTLIELLIALSLFAFVATALAACFRAGLKAWRRAEEDMRLQQEARVALEQMGRELRNVFPFPGRALTGTENEITFFSVKNGLGAKTGVPQIFQVTYRLAGKDGINVLERVQRNYPAASDARGDGAQAMSTFDTGMKLEYARPAADGGWAENWPGTEANPQSVRVSLTLREKNGGKDFATFAKTLFIPPEYYLAPGRTARGQ